MTVWQPTSAAYDLVVVGHDLTNLGRYGPPDSSQLLSIERLSEAMPPGVAIEKLERRFRPPDGGYLRRVAR